MTFHTDLSDCMFRDSYVHGGSFYDWCPAGGLVMSTGGRIAVTTSMIQHIPCRAWKDKAALDRGIYRLLRKGAESRVGGIVEVDTKRVRRFIQFSLATPEGRQLVCHPNEAKHLRPRLKAYGVDKVHASRVVPTKLILVLPHPEVMLGWLCGTDLAEVGLALRHPEYVAGCTRTGDWPEWGDGTVPTRNDH